MPSSDPTLPSPQLNHLAVNPRFDFNCHPSVVMWEITRACSVNGRLTPKRHRDPSELSPQEALHCIDQIVATRPSLLILTGGDLLERPDLEAIISSAANHGLRIALSPWVTPNLAKADLAFLRQIGAVRLCVNLYGVHPATHDEFVGTNGSWKWTCDAIDHAKSAGMEVQINTTFTRQNRGEYEALVSFHTETKPVVWNINGFIPKGTISSSELLDGSEIENLFEQLALLKSIVPYEITTTDAPHFRRIAIQHHDCSIMKNLACASINDGRGLVFLNHLGEISPGRFLPIHTGNVREEKLINTYRNHRIFRELRNPTLLKGKCGSCEFNSICGGARAGAYSATGDYLAQDRFCTYQPKMFTKTEPWRMYCDE